MGHCVVNTEYSLTSADMHLLTIGVSDSFHRNLECSFGVSAIDIEAYSHHFAGLSQVITHRQDHFCEKANALSLGKALD